MLAVQAAAMPAAAPAAADESVEPDKADQDNFDDGPKPGDSENPFRDTSPVVNVSSRLAQSQTVIENLQKNLGTKLRPATIETLKSKYSTATPAPLAQPEVTLDDLLTPTTSPLLPVKSRVEVQQRKQHTNGKPAAFDVSNVNGQSSVKLAFLSGKPVKKATESPKLAPRLIGARNLKKPSPTLQKTPAPNVKPPLPAKKDSLLSIIQAKPLALPKVTSAKKKAALKPRAKPGQQDGLSELLKNLVSDNSATSTWTSKSTEKFRGGEGEPVASADTTVTTAPIGRTGRPLPAPRTSSLPANQPAKSVVQIETTFLSSPSRVESSPAGRCSRQTTVPATQSSPTTTRPQSLSPTHRHPERPSPATSPGRTPPERSQLLEEKLNEIRKDLWHEDQDAAPPDQPGSRRHDSASDTATSPSRSVQEETLEHYARAIQKHLDGNGSVPVAPRLNELRVDTDYSSTHSSTSTLVSSPAQSPGWEHKPRTEETGTKKKKLREELLGFYYRSLERGRSRSGRQSAPPVPCVIPTDNATYTPDRTLRQEFLVVRDGRPPPSPLRESTYQNLPHPRRQPRHYTASPSLASGEDSDSTYASQDRNMNFFVRGGPQRNTIGSYPARKTPPKDEVDLRREFGGDVELRHPEKMVMINKKRHNSESETVNGKAKGGKSGMFEAWSNGKVQKDVKKNKNSVSPSSGGKKSLFPPIFRKGSLHPTSSGELSDSTPGTPPPALPKRVSFSSASSPMYPVTPPNGDSWPTRNGPAATPPTRPSRLDSSDSVFLPNPGYISDSEVYARHYRAQEQIYANQFSPPPNRLPLGEETYVNYTMPTPPEVTRGPIRVRSPSEAVYGNSLPNSNGVVYGSTQLHPGHYGSTPSRPHYRTTAGIYGTTPSPVGSACSPPGAPGTRASPGATPNGTPVGTPVGTPNGTAHIAARNSPLGTPNGVAYSPSQPPSGPAFGSNSSPGSASLGSVPSPGQTVVMYGRTLPPRAQSATPTMMMAPDRPLPPIPGASGIRGSRQHSQHSQLTLSESESGSEAGEVQRILQQANEKKKITYFKFPGEST